MLNSFSISKPSISKSVIRKIQRSIVEFDMLFDQDRVLVGLSGGKDSIFLLCALNTIRQHASFSFELAAITVDFGFKPAEDNDYRHLAEICNNLGVPFIIKRAELAQEILHNEKQNPCARCSYFRRAMIHNFARAEGYNKVAFAHHLDDAIETFLMSILYSGQIRTFQPKTYLDKTEVIVIRPLAYLREYEIKKALSILNIQAMPSPCPLSGNTKRTEIKELLRKLKKINPHVIEHIVAAMREGRTMQLWPAEPTKIQIRAKSALFWGGERKENGKADDN